MTKKLEAEIPISEYRFFRTIAKTEGKTVREAIKEAIKDWVVRRKKLKNIFLTHYLMKDWCLMSN